MHHIYLNLSLDVCQLVFFFSIMKSQWRWTISVKNEKWRKKNQLLYGILLTFLYHVAINLRKSFSGWIFVTDWSQLTGKKVRCALAITKGFYELFFFSIVNYFWGKDTDHECMIFDPIIEMQWLPPLVDICDVWSNRCLLHRIELRD